eukprot:GHRR01025689.1.p1 GENE.GHRR01025689.1~~GHRR01025689.1.p1  ORF type:complete len:339 (+),score=98.20 GHRR01025689.1:1137-2153(+)
MASAFALQPSRDVRVVAHGKKAVAVAQQRCNTSVPNASWTAKATVNTRMMPIASITKALEQCKGILLDQFGVLHDGQRPYPNAIAAVQRMHAAGKKVVVLSNSSRRSGGTLGKLARMGFKEEWFAGAITSGELTHQYLSTRPDAWWQELGHRCLHITWPYRGAVSLAGLGLQVVTDPAQADFILAHGTEAVSLPGQGTQGKSLQELEQLLQHCAGQTGRKPPMVVANPDLVTVDGPSLVTMPGTLARIYQQLGGEVQLMGKPDPIIYTAAVNLVPGLSCSSQEWLAVGDSLEHDIAGAQQAGMKSLFIIGGIHAEAAKLQGMLQCTIGAYLVSLHDVS